LHFWNLSSQTDDTNIDKFHEKKNTTLRIKWTFGLWLCTNLISYFRKKRDEILKNVFLHSNYFRRLILRTRVGTKVFAFVFSRNLVFVFAKVHDERFAKVFVLTFGENAGKIHFFQQFMPLLIKTSSFWLRCFRINKIWNHPSKMFRK
jgi:hypothetical protein